MKIPLDLKGVALLKDLVKKWDDSEHARSIFKCPNCQAKCQFQIAWHSSMPANILRISAWIKYYVLECTACQGFIFLHTDERHPTLNLDIPKIVYQFPPAGIKLHSSIPPEVAIDFREASICLSIGAWNATTVMCRRALQSCAKDKKVNPKDDLFEQLKELKAKDVISGVLYEVADAIRAKGNIGAHPGKNPVTNNNISEKEARTVFDLVKQIFRYVYELPHEVQALKGP